MAWAHRLIWRVVNKRACDNPTLNCGSAYATPGSRRLKFRRLSWSRWGNRPSYSHWGSWIGAPESREPRSYRHQCV